MKEFNLSDRIATTNFDTITNFIRVKDVREAVRLLKEELKTDLTGCFTSKKQCDEWNEDTNKIIDKIFGERLSKHYLKKQLTNSEEIEK